MLNSKEKLYEGIEFIMHAISAACVAISVESIVESVVSIYETRQTKLRTLDDDTDNHEMQIGYNGLEPANTENRLKKAVDSYFKNHKKANGTLLLTQTDLNIVCQRLLTKKFQIQANYSSWTASSSKGNICFVGNLIGKIYVPVP